MEQRANVQWQANKADKSRKVGRNKHLRRDHVIPVGYVWKQILAMRPITVTEVERILTDLLEVRVITGDQHHAINDNTDKNNPPLSDSWAVYRKAGMLPNDFAIPEP
jgi:hypothetical protein